MTALLRSLARVPRPVLLWSAAALVMMPLFVLWPYQHWAYGAKHSVLGGWWRLISEDDSGEWIFCPVVPVVSGVMAWLRRRELAKLPMRGDPRGLLILLFGAFCYWVGYKADTGYPGFAAVQLMSAGLILWFCGRQWMRVLLFPWLFLVFMWPAFPLEDQIALPMRMVTAGWSSGLLNLLGVPNIREGTGIQSAADAVRGLAQGQLFKLDVEVPCSGIRSLYSLLMLAALYGYIFLRGWKPRLLLFLSALPLAMLGNLVRMVMLGLASVWWGMEFAIGRMNNGEMTISAFHELAGFAVFGVALLGIFAISSVLEGVPWKKRQPGSARAGIHGSDEIVPDPSQQRALRVIIAVVLALGTVALCATASTQPPLSPPGLNMTLPRSVGSMPGQEIPMTQRERDGLASDVHLSRMLYLTPGGKPMLTSLVLSGETRRGLHRPDVCLPGQGWVIVDKQVVPVKFTDGRDRDAMMLRVYRDVPDQKTGRMVRQRGINLFWFQGYNDLHTPEYYTHVAYTYIDSVFKNLNHRWALATFFTQMPDTPVDQYDGIAEAAALEELRDFISQIGPIIIKRPGEP